MRFSGGSRKQHNLDFALSKPPCIGYLVRLKEPEVFDWVVPTTVTVAV